MSLKQTPFDEFLPLNIANKIKAVISEALNAVDPYKAIYQHVKREGNILSVNDHVFDLNRYRKIYLTGAGKASIPMAKAVVDLLGNRIDAGIIITKSLDTTIDLPENILCLEGAHPIPDEKSITATQTLLNLLAHTDTETLIIHLISGGGSALMELPMPNLTLEDIQLVNRLLLTSGATIHEINTIRKHLSTIKGGGFIREASPASVVTFILSDVIGDDLSVIASGQTVGDPTTYSQCLEIIQKYHLENQTPDRVLRHLQKGVEGNIPETPKPNDPVFDRVTNIIIGNLAKAVTAAHLRASQEGFNSLILGTTITGEACEVGKVFAAIAKQLATSNHPLPKPACIIAGGETTVTVTGNGKGGRNLELALSIATIIKDTPNIACITLATDGDDGETGAAGAIVTSQTFFRARQLNISPESYLRNNDSYSFFHQTGGLIITGLTHTNVNDLIFIFSY